MKALPILAVAMGLLVAVGTAQAEDDCEAVGRLGAAVYKSTQEFGQEKMERILRVREREWQEKGNEFSDELRLIYYIGMGASSEAIAGLTAYNYCMTKRAD